MIESCRAIHVLLALTVICNVASLSPEVGEIVSQLEDVVAVHAPLVDRARLRVSPSAFTFVRDACEISRTGVLSELLQPKKIMAISVINNALLIFIMVLLN